MTPEDSKKEMSSDSERKKFSADVPEEPPHYVLRRGEILGPFQLGEMTELVAGGLLEYDDFVQKAGTPDWVPLRWVLIPRDGEDLEGALAPRWLTLLKWSWLRLRYNLDEQSLVAGWVCLALALAGLFLSRWPVLLWGPWAVLAFIAGAALYKRRRVFPGIALMLCTMLIPGGLWAWFWAGSIAAVRDGGGQPVASVAPTRAIVTTTKIVAATPAPLPVLAQASKHVPTPQPEVPEIIISPAKIAYSAPLVTPLPVKVSRPAAAPAPQVAPDTGVSGVFSETAVAIGARPVPSELVPAFGDTAEEAVPRMVAAHQNNLVFVADSGGGGAGSGFICQIGGKQVLLSNFHVIAGMKSAKFTRLSREIVTPVPPVTGAVGHDIIRYEMPTGTATTLIAAQSVEAVAAIGDEVVVLGNSEGAGVIQPLAGKLVGIGPDRVEVSAEFVPGNSGSPIIHVKSGQVIGICTYLTRRDTTWLDGNSSGKTDENVDKKIRRFGFRLDSVKQWQAVDWSAFNRDRHEIEKIDRFTRELSQVLIAIRAGNLESVANSAVSGPAIREFLGRVKTSGSVSVSRPDAMKAVENFFGRMKSLSQRDIQYANSIVRHDYFRRALEEEKQIRDRFTTVFSEALKVAGRY